MGRKVFDATFGRFFAAIYDRLMAGTEDKGLRETRARLLADARGRTLELGAGTGLNLGHYPEAVTELVLTEPFEPMAKRARAKLESLGREPDVVAAPAESLPFDDASFDTVVSTLVLCTVRDPARSLAEIRRVLKPGGRLLFIEHVRSDDPKLAKWQDRLRRPWFVCGHGCNCNRETLASIGAAGLEVDSVEHGELPEAPPIVRPMVTGSAIAPS